MNEIIVGRRGLGKSVLAAYEANNLNPNNIFFDPGDQFHQVDLKTADLRELREKLTDWPDDKSYSISYVPPKGNVEANWNLFAATLWDFIGQHDGAASFVLIVDEAHRLQSPQYINDWLDEWIRRSPRRERDDANPIDILQTTHAPQDLHRVSWGESDYIFLFNIFDKRALKAIDEQFQDRIPNIREIVTSLKTPKTGGREVVKIESETGQYWIITDQDSWFFDIRNRKPPANSIEAIDRELKEAYGTL